MKYWDTLWMTTWYVTPAAVTIVKYWKGCFKSKEITRDMNNIPDSGVECVHDQQC